MSLQDKITEIAGTVCRAHQLYLVEVCVKGDNRRPVFQIFADSEKGITLGQCEQISRAIKDELDMDDDFSMNYRLDVSSPGLDRPLTEPWQFRKNMGYEIEVEYHSGDQAVKTWGKLVNVGADSIELEDKHGRVTIAFKNINRAKAKIQW